MTGAALSLTQQEAEQRAALLEVSRYDIAVDLTDLAEGTDVRCVSTIAFSCREPGASTFLDCCADVVTATLNGEPVGPADSGRIALPDLRADNVVVVESVQPRTTDGEGVHKSVDPTDGEVYVWMSFEPDEARQVWACFDQPDLKAPHAFTVTAPSAWTVVSNSGDVAVHEVEGARRWAFPDTPPLSTYNPVVLAGPFHEIRRTVGGHDLGLFARRSLAAVLDRDSEELFTVTGQGMAFFGEAFEMPFPQQKYDQVFVPELGGAMENYGCVTWSDAFLTRVPPTPSEQELLAAVLLHEMAHMWFGNIVTMRWWDDLWLNEAFAEFAANWALSKATRFTDAWARHLADDKQQAYLADMGPRSHPIREPVPDVAAAAAAFDAITYPKGASVLQQLMTYLGEETFTRGMAAYFARHAWGNTTLQDLMDALATASGRDLDRWRASWLEEAGADVLTLERSGSGFELVATPAPGTSAPRPHVVGVGAYRRTPQGLTRIAFETVEVAGESAPRSSSPRGRTSTSRTTTTSPSSGATPRPVRVPPCSSSPPSCPRPPRVAWPSRRCATCWSPARHGPPRSSSAWSGVLRAETAPTCVEPYLALVTRVAEYWSPEGEREALSQLVAQTSAWFVEQGRYPQAALRSWARTGSLADLDQLGEAATHDVDLQWRVLVRRAELGDVAGDDVLDRLVQQDTDPEAWVRALIVRTAAADAEAKAAGWEALVEHRKVPISSIGAVGNAFWRPGQDEVLAPYAERYLEAVPTLDHGGMIPAMGYARALFPVFAIDASYLDRAIDVSHEAAPVVRARLEERADEVRRMMVTRAL